MASISPGGAYLHYYADMCLPLLSFSIHSMARFLRADDLKRHVRTVHSKDVDGHLCVPHRHHSMWSPSHSTYVATSSSSTQKSNLRANAAWPMSKNLNVHGDTSLTQPPPPITIGARLRLSPSTTLASLLKRSLRRSLPMARAKGMGPMAR